MDDSQRAFLESLLETSSPSGFEQPGQRVWVEYVSAFADEVRTDEYGNAVAVHEGDGDAEIAIAGHGDEIGFMVREITDDGLLRLARIGGSDRTVTRGQHVTIHADEGPVAGVVGQVAIHLREGDDEVADVPEQYVDIGVESEEEAQDRVEIGDPITFSSGLRSLADTRLAARGMDNRVGIWTAAEALRQASEADADATVYAVSTVQEELGLRGARMVGFDLDPDAIIAVDVTHATDTPDVPGKRSTGVELGAGPVVARGSANHPQLVEALREVADAEDVDVQLQATGIRTGTDADAFYTQRGGIPSLNLGLPNRYMHTPVEVIDTDDLDAAATALGAFAIEAEQYAPFAVDLDADA
ncbi:M42 family peptidase [Halorhabdus sp. CBA1104]|uniref:M20/M25/M40 family metallo-hydrolase n=1 Tax=unclassified Halorhabdus TaxID=2621901 RepID=UPI0012B28D67|nr:MULTISPECIES: M20/M25/M40 family metallo-hydrolase [unclassified Halorhabdus]QGN06463.1 M42 family peptidase [Halorhabdus sp. CBA1104]